MSEAEKKWEEFDDNNRYHIDFPKTKPEVSRDSREAYKAALRREIEKRNQDNDYLHQWTTSEILELLDTVEP